MNDRRCNLTPNLYAFDIIPIRSLVVMGAAVSGECEGGAEALDVGEFEAFGEVCEFVVLGLDIDFVVFSTWSEDCFGAEGS